MKYACIFPGVQGAAYNIERQVTVMAMLYPTYSDIINSINEHNGPEAPQVSSRYTVVIAAAKRARQIVDHAPTDGDVIDDKPLSIAIDEINSGKILVEVEEKAE